MQYNANNVKFYINGKELERVTNFNYLGRIFSENDSDLLCIQSQINKARARWNGIAKILKREGANAKTMGRFYLAVVQAVLLYGSGSWTVTRRDLKKLESFHLRAVRHMTGSHIRCVNDEWEYPNHNYLLNKCRLHPIEKYIERRRGTLMKYFMNYRKDA